MIKIKKSVITSVLVASVLLSYVGMYRLGVYLAGEGLGQHNNNHRGRQQQGSKTKRINGHITLSCHDRGMAINDSASQRRLKATAGEKKQKGGKRKRCLGNGRAGYNTRILQKEQQMRPFLQRSSHLLPRRQGRWGDNLQ